MGTRISAPDAEIAAWIARLETEPRWTTPLRIERRKRGCEPCDLVLVVALASDFPKTANRYYRVDGYVIVAGTVGEFFDTALPVSNLEALRIREPIDRSHAILLVQAHGRAFRFRPPCAE